MGRIVFLLSTGLFCAGMTGAVAQSIPGTPPLSDDEFILRGSDALAEQDLVDAIIEDADPLVDQEITENQIPGQDNGLNGDQLRLRNEVLAAQASLSDPSVLRTPVIRRADPKALAEPYDALGVKVGTFILRSSVDISTGYSDNVEGDSDGEGGAVITVEPDITLESDWSRHSVSLQLTGAYETFPGTDQEDDPTLTTTLRGRLDISNGTQVETELSYTADRQAVSNADVATDAISGPLIQTFSGDIAVDHQINRLTLRASGGLERQIFSETELANGTVDSNDDQESFTFTGTLRATYEISPALSPFGEVVVEREIFDEEVDDNGLERDTTALVARAGATFNLRGTLTGEVSVGLVHSQVDDSQLDDITNVAVNGTVTWSPTVQTTVTGDLGTSIESTTLADASGSLLYTAGLSVAHDLTEQWGLEGGLDISHNDFVGIDQTDTTVTANANVVYRFNRALAALAEVRHEQFFSTEDGADFIANSFLLGLRLQQ